ncbi:MAG: MotA/TolQ/ExbB proton channel family protein [Planctomycetota bacterium]
MDIATIIGLILGFGLILASIMMGGDGLTPFIDIPSMMIVFGGAIAATLINFPLKACLGSFAVVMKCFLFKLPDPGETIEQLKDMAGIAKKDGLLALESKMEEVSDPFLKRGIEALIGGASADSIRHSLETEVSYIDQRHTNGKKIVDSCGAAAPAFGMIGTLIGLVMMLRNLSDPSQIGAGMATALLTTLYGALVANVVCIPLAGKLETRNAEDTTLKELMIEGVCAIGEGSSPALLEEQLLAFLSPGTRATILKGRE